MSMRRLIISVVALGFGLIVGSLGVVAEYNWQKRHLESRIAKASADAKAVSLAILQYEQDNGRIPEAGKWRDAIKDYSSLELRSEWQDKLLQFELSRAVAGRKLSEFDNWTDTVMLTWKRTLPDGRSVAAYIDSHVSETKSPEKDRLHYPQPAGHY